jgi:ribosomal-protein-alanine N-acetyltransferase
MSESSNKIRVERASMRHGAEFVSAVRRSAALHRSWVSPPTTSEALRAYLKAKRGPANVSYFVFSEMDDALIGVININEIVRGLFQSAYLGYYAFAPHHGRGHMSHALATVMKLAFSEHGLHRLEANIQPSNAASIALVRRAGFKREGFSKRYLKIAGRWRDHERWAITLEDWSRRGRARKPKGQHVESL